IVEALVQAPDVLLLDEPTNHLDLAGIKWLEGLHQHAAFACVVVSHDRAKYAGFRRPILPHLSVVLTPGHVHTVYTNAVNLFDLALRAHHEISKL
ncbi:MAG TPA: hypothetical protein VFU86_04000, partial [Terriglobales bacterium]|nr:hypothetical protein [Terriglobales bacterium]